MIEARGLVKRYGSTTAVDHLSFDVRPGTVTGFLGPNGAGKTITESRHSSLARRADCSSLSEAVFSDWAGHVSGSATCESLHKALPRKRTCRRNLGAARARHPDLAW